MSVIESAEPRSAPPAVGTVEEAEALVQRLAETMEQLLAVVEEETRFVRAGRLREAEDLAVQKTNLARRYVRDTDCLRANGEAVGRLVPTLVEELRRGHGMFRAVLEINLTVLATAQAVSEGIMRNVAAEMAERERPKSYGPATARPAPHGPSRPIAVSKAL